MNQIKDSKSNPLALGSVVTLAAVIIGFTGRLGKDIQCRAVGEPREYVPEFEINSSLVTLEAMKDEGEVPNEVRESKSWRKAIDDTIQRYRKETPGAIREDEYNAKITALAEGLVESPFRASHERGVAASRLWESVELTGVNKIVKMTEAVMWLGMDLKAINEASARPVPGQYPEGNNPASAKIEAPADGLKL